MRRVVLLLALLAAVFTVSTAPAMAATYPPSSAVLTAPRTVTTSNTSVTITGRNFVPASTVTITVNGVVRATRTVSSTGTFTYVFREARPGTYTVKASGGGRSASITMRVKPRLSALNFHTASASGGADGTAVWVGATVLVLGFSLGGLLLARRRSRV